MTTVLLTAAVKTTLVLVMTLALGAATRRRAAAVRHWLLTVGLTCTLLVPVLSALWPSFLAAPLPTGAIAPHASATSGMPAEPFPGGNDGTENATAMIVGTPPPSAPRGWTMTGTRLVVLAWALGAALALSRLGWGLTTLRRLGRRATEITEGPWRTACDTEARRVGLTRPVCILRGAEAVPVITWGWHRPAILIPDEALAWTPARRDLVLAHELAHVARGDWTAQLIGEAVRALHWYQPLAWLANRRLRVDAEHAADDRVVASGVDGTDYASHLLALAQHTRSRAPWTPAPAVARPSSLEGRIRAMLNTSIDRTPLNRRSQFRVAALAFAAMLPLAALTTAQTQFHTLSGTLVDATGRALPNVAVSLVNETTAARYEIRSDASGRYEFIGLPAATYALAATTVGFQPRRESVALTGDRDLPLRLAVGTLVERVNVVSGAPPAPEAPEAADRARAAERSTRAAERQAKAVAACAAGVPSALGGNILPPIKIRHVNPAYPEQARAAGVGGTVTLRAVIDTTGAVRETRQVSGPSADLETAAVEAVREWRFTPTLLNCDAIEVEMDVTVDFTAPK